MSSGGKHDTAVPRRRSRRQILTALVALVLICGVVVGYAHWHVHRLESADVAWSAPLDYEGETTVAAGNAYVFDNFDGFDVIRMSDGKTLASQLDSEALSMFVGRSGWFVTVSQQSRPTMTFYSPTGKKMWQRAVHRGEPVQWIPQSIGDGTITYRDCATRGSCRMTSLDRTGRQLWSVDSLPGVRLGVEHRENRDQVEVNRGEARLQVLPTVAVVNRAGRVTALGHDGLPTGESIDATDSILVGHTLVEVARDGDSCAYRGVRAGKEIWRTTADCSRMAGVSNVLAYPRRIFVSYDRKDGTSPGMVSIRLSDGHTHVHTKAWLGFDPATRTSRSVGEDVIVDQRKGRLTGIDPDTGDTMWHRTFSSKTGTPAVYVSKGAVAVLSSNSGFWRAMALRRDQGNDVVTIIEPRSGDVSARLLQESLTSTVGLGSASAMIGLDGGRGLVLADDRLFSIGAD